MAELTSLRNIGKEIEKKLIAVEINSAEELKSIGSKEAFFRLKTQFQNICLVHLYTLEGAILDIDYNRLPDEIKKDLKEYSNSLK